nr:aminotransferase class V-fold PLP-dependent enzyme [Hyphomonas sp. Mor2]
MREFFNVPDNYFLSHSVGCLPRTAPDHLQQTYFDPWKTKGGDAWPGWLDALESFRDRLGELFGCPARNLCPQTNVSSGLTKLLYGLPDRGDKTTILCSVEDFPSIGFVLKQAERTGFRVRFMDGDVTDMNAWTDAWDDSVGIVLITHAYSNTSKLAPVAELCTLARARGAISVVDVAQSAGAIPIEFNRWQPDFALGTGVKFLCFGPGACFLYASDEMIETCRPLDVGWFSHEAPFEMDIHRFRYAESAMRFLGGTPSPAPFVLANAAMDVWQKLGIEPVQTRIQMHLDQLCAAVPPEILQSPRDSKARGGTFVVDPPDRMRFRQTIQDSKICCDEREPGFRFSVHGYTDASDIDHLLEALIKGQK